MTIIVSKEGMKTQKIEKSYFERENYLQNYIHENPESIPVDEIEKNKRLFVVAREFSTESGPIDALAIDKDGDIYVVETKLYKNPDKRRVVAQALDYGASLWRHSDTNEFIDKINNEITLKFKISFGEKIKDFFAIEEEQVKPIIDAMKNNLQQGVIKFVILMDSVADNLKDLIFFINKNSQFDIYAVQMEYYQFEKYEIMIPKMFGNEIKKDVNISKPLNSNDRWDEEKFLEAVKNGLKGEDVTSLKLLYEFSKDTADDINWGAGKSGSINPKFLKICPRSLYSLYSDGTLRINFRYLDMNEYKEKFKKELEELGGFDISDEYQKTLSFNPIENWGPKVNDFIRIVKDLVGIKS